MAGEVRISAGQGFERIAVSTKVVAGTQVMVSPGGSASIAYSRDCVVTVAPAAIAVVENRPPCAVYPEPSYLGITQSNEQGLNIGGAGWLTFTPKVDDLAPNAEVSEQPSNGETPPTGDVEAPAEVPVDVPIQEADKKKKKEEKIMAPLPLPSAGTAQKAKEEKHPWDHTYTVVGGAVLGAGVLAAILLLDDDPASP